MFKKNKRKTNIRYIGEKANVKTVAISNSINICWYVTGCSCVCLPNFTKSCLHQKFIFKQITKLNWINRGRKNGAIILINNFNKPRLLGQEFTITFAIT